MHPDKIFEDFSRQYCITEFDLAVQNLPIQSRKRRLKVVAIVFASSLAILGVLGATGYILTKKYLDKNLKTETTQSILTSSWNDIQIGKSALQLSLPFNLSKQEIPLPEAAKSLIDTMESYSHLSDNGFKVMVSVANYKEGIEANLDGAIAGSVGEMQNMQGINDFKWDRIDTTISSLKGCIAIVNFKLLTYQMEVKLLTVCNKNIIYQVYTQYSKDDETGKKAADRILASATIGEK
jgi:hypothetical protein